jgi:hypothetical protein
MTALSSSVRRLLLIGLCSSFGALVSLGGCVSDSPVGPNDSATNDSPTTQDGSPNDVVQPDVIGDGSGDVDAAPPPCGEAGEDCCKAPFAPCTDGLACSTSSPQKCMVSEAWALGSYSTILTGQMYPSTAIVTAHYDGSTWTLGKTVAVFNFDFNSYYPVDIYENGTQVRVITNQADKGHEYWWNSVSWAECTPGNSCDGPTQTSDVWAITSTDNNGSTDYWLAGTGVMYRCPSTSLCAKVTGVPGSIGEGNFAGEKSQDLWYSSVDHIYHFDGNTWTSTALADTVGLYDVTSTDIWTGYKQLRHWDGNAWQGPYLIGGTQTPGLIWSIGGAATDDVFAVGNDYNSGNAAFAGHWDGTGWKLTTVPPMTGTQKVYAPSRIEAFMVGGANPGDAKGVFAHWNGTAWSTMTPPSVSVANEKTAGSGTVQWEFVTGRARPRGH